MKRRRFVKGLATIPAVMAIEPALIFGQRGGRGGATVEPPPEIVYGMADEVGDPLARFFLPEQFTALEKLAGILMPSGDGNPGALDTDAPEFLDFLIGASTPSRQQLYRNGLDALNERARGRAGRLFADLDAEDAGSVLAPLSAPWSYEPADPFEKFLRQAREDIRTATQNSRAWALATGNVRNTRYLLPL